ncbi:D-alanyl-D-alanine carboxypeptidase precursor [Roseovarius sp. THAF27]|uniref:serine hydrolase domain-containing protein n=1 Tax=unclassified Roseovarius TaxID=2614913 RepID=UPI001268E394|nr:MULTISPECIES: serine hydrolase [unclassified Roseovarius]QFT81096.1 D-alanyl-D-alanine carboxypeptidase precursor [Roseovarius sp. THAF27]QFT95754.1 D-alanyl-D-alanine carboxypeptidase precursor [Roseovarius sp. THAF8]
MPCLDRRHFLAISAAFVGSPAHSQPASWRTVADAGQALDQLHAVLIHQHGAEVFGEVFRGPEMGTPAPIKSVSKTVVAALTGAAIDRGEISSVDATIGELAPGLIPDDADPRVHDITIENLVTMQAGLERTSGPNYGGWVSSENWVANALSRPFETDPGARMLYSTGSFHVLGAILSEVSGQSLLDQARDRLGAPLGIRIPPWTRDPQGRYLGGNEMSLSLPAMIHFGEMYRRKGMWGDTHVLSEAWVSRSFEPVTRSPWSGLRYGYGWFLGQSEGDAYALARGYGGQIICVVPGLGLTIAITSDSTQPARSAGYFGDLMRLIEGTILPLARKDTT